MPSHDISLSVPAPLPGGRSEAEIMSAWSSASAPLVTIICHTFNHAGFIADTINGFLSQQTRFPFEIIVRDDASTDGTSSIVAEFARRYPRLIRAIIEAENQFSRGVAPSTVTFPLARGEFIALCEGDDYWCDASKLHRQIICLSEQPTAGMSIHPATMIRQTGTSLDARSFCDRGPHEAILPVRNVLTHYGQFAPTSSYLFRADCTQEWNQFLGKLNPTFGDFFLECIASRGKLAYLPQVMSVYRRDHAGSYSALERGFDGMKQLDRFHRNAEATRTLNRYAWINDDDIQCRLAVLRLDYLRKLARAGAFKEINKLVADGPIATETLADRIHMHFSRRMPRIARFLVRNRNLLDTNPITQAPGVPT